MQVQTLILGAGAAGLFCAGRTGSDTLIVDHASAAGEKIRISGGGRCNFTNLHTSAANFLSENRHFAKSALSRYTPQDFLALLATHRIPWHEKTLGQLFCDGSAKDIIGMLLAEMAQAGAALWLDTSIDEIGHDGTGFQVRLTRAGRSTQVNARHLVVATGGKSIPKMGATGIGYRIAEQFGLAVTETRPALVPLTFDPDRFRALAGVSLPVRVRCGKQQFDEAMLFTHRGLSGPAILQISSYWHEGQAISVDLTPQTDLLAGLQRQRRQDAKKAIKTVLAQYIPARLADVIGPNLPGQGAIGDQSDAVLALVCDLLRKWEMQPLGTEGYRTAEVTLGGVATSGLDSGSMQARRVPGLYFIGECVDVTGWLGGYNFQWAWASAAAAAAAIRGSR